MTVQSHFNRLVSQTVIQPQEKLSIARSINTLGDRLNRAFGAQVSTHFQFGSSTRGTMLPRGIDERSDVDYLVVFSEHGYGPQAYIDRLRRFAERWYSTSEVVQRSPTVVLNLNHIRFELVPALSRYSGQFQIPAPASSYMDWMPTHPTSVNDQLKRTDSMFAGQVIPTIRLLKWWNILDGRLFESFALESWAAQRVYFLMPGVKAKFFDCILSCHLGWDAAQWKAQRLERAKDIVVRTRQLENAGMMVQAELEIKKLLP